MTDLSSLATGEMAHITGIHAPDDIRQRLQAMGLVPPGVELPPRLVTKPQDASNEYPVSRAQRISSLREEAVEAVMPGRTTVTGTSPAHRSATTSPARLL